MAVPPHPDPEAEAFQVETYRRMGGSGRAQVMFRLSAMARTVAEAGIRARHPDYDDAQVGRALTRLLHGDEPTRLAWPSQRLLEP
jgi:hypothetical protein